MEALSTGQAAVAVLSTFCQLAHAGLSLGLVETLDSLVRNGHIVRQSDGRLMGAYAHALIALGSVASLGVTAWTISLASALRGRKVGSLPKLVVVLTAMATVTTLAMFGLNLSVLTHDDSVETQGERYRVKRPYGVSSVILSAMNAGFAVTAACAVMFWQASSMSNKFGPYPPATVSKHIPPQENLYVMYHAPDKET